MTDFYRLQAPSIKRGMQNSTGSNNNNSIGGSLPASSGARVATFHVTMDDDRLEVKPEHIARIYGLIDAKARQIAPEPARAELRITQDGRIKTRFYIAVSDRMAPHLVAAVQQVIMASSAAAADGRQQDYGIGLKSYFYRLQEQLMAQMFAGAKDVIQIG